MLAISPETSNAAVTFETQQSSGGFNMLFLIDRLTEMGGAELALMRLARDLPSRGVHPIVVAFQQEISPEFCNLFSCPVFAIPLTRTYDYSAWCAARSIRTLIRKHKIQLVHTFFETSDLFGGLVTKTLPGVVLVSSRRDMGILRLPKHRLAYRALSWMPDRVVTVSNTVRDWCIREDHLTPDRVVTVYNGVDRGTSPSGADCHQDREVTRHELGLQPDQVAFTAVGHIRHVKGFDILIEAAERVVKNYPHSVFLIAGDEHEAGRLAELETMIRTRALGDSIRLLGSVKDTAALFRASDIFVLPSRSEGFSNALIEAMTAALPCVATDVGGNAEALLDGQNGYIVPTENPAALADACQRLLSDSSLRSLMGKTSQRLALDRFTQPAMVHNMLEVYRDALQRFSRVPVQPFTQHRADQISQRREKLS